MPRMPPPPRPKGSPRVPGSGRRKGTPNRTTVELRELMRAAAGDVYYQRKFREAFVKRRLHPSTEIKVWEYSIGKPTDRLELSANVTLDEHLATERDRLRQLDLHELEALYAESQALVDRAVAASQARRQLPRQLPPSSTASGEEEPNL